MNSQSIELSIKTVADCNRMCKNCLQKKWFKRQPGFHTSLEQIKTLIKTSRLYHYHYSYIILSGGDPLLWKHIKDGAKLLYESGIADTLKLFTNGLSVTANNRGEIENILKHVDEFRITLYNDNQKNIDYALQQWGGLYNKKGGKLISIVDHKIHAELPENIINHTLPAKCSCKALSMVGDYVYICGSGHIYMFTHTSITGGSSAPVALSVGSDFYNKFRSGWGDDFERRYMIPWCGMCIANQKVLKHLKRVTA